MEFKQSRRRFVKTISSGGAAGLLGLRWRPAQAEPPPETTKIRLAQIAGICIAPQYVAGELLRLEGFTQIEYPEFVTNSYPALASGKIDLTMSFVAHYIAQQVENPPVVILGGVHTGCFELFGTDSVRAIRDLKGKTVAVPEQDSAHRLFVVSMAAYVGLDPIRDINFVYYSPAESIPLLADKKIDALMCFPPIPQELRARKVGHPIMSSGIDRPWSQYFCCIVGANRDFVRANPVATKRAMRAILKAADYCAAAPETVARALAQKGYQYEYALQTMREIRYARWQDYDPEDSVRFYALRLHEAGIVKSTPRSIIAQGTDWRFFNELRRELKG